MKPSNIEFEASIECARALDAADPLLHWRDEFCIPKTNNRAQIYLCGNSLGLQPKRLQAEMDEELDAWRRYGVAGHFEGKHPWMPYHEFVREPLGRLLGAHPDEVVAMNSLTVNLHLMMVSFYRPTPKRHRIVIEKGAFPSDRYAVESQIRFHGYNPESSLVELIDSDGSGLLSLSTLDAYLHEHGERVALVLMPGVQYATGQFTPPGEVVELARRHGCQVGFDLAHAAGNLPLTLHDDDADFAVWCSYKYLNSGAGAVAGCFVHRKHSQRTDLPRFAGWWGHDPSTRFKMGDRFVPAPGADAWQLSNPPIYGLAPVRVSLGIFDEAGIHHLREKSITLTAYLEYLLKTRLGDRIAIRTPSDPEKRGCQLSLAFADAKLGKSVHEAMEAAGFVGDWREPDVLRASPVPLYNHFSDVFQFVDELARRLSQ